LTAAGLQAAFRQKMAFLAAGFPLAVMAMHIPWGAGFLWSMIRGIFTPGAAKRK
jgi:hypothetical protein